ncbi:DnaJ domain-containing protein [Sulfurimonas sp. HSL-1716]|uniref:DnaJ domain-containing protein n=1 Tax=Hydrocurvibacter sulfurireducens TaxID=3131937 RepID=UPI0031F913EF
MNTIILMILVLGVFLYLSKGYRRYNTNYEEQFKNFSVSKEAIERSELGVFVSLVAKVAKADGRVDALEAELVGNMFTDVSRVFPEPEKTRDILKQIFNEQKDITGNTEALAQTLQRLIYRDKNKQIQMMGFLIQLAFVDGEVSKSEEQVLISIAEALQIDPKIYHGIFDQFESMIKNARPQATLDDAYKILGVHPQDSLETIKKAYRKLVREYHPDIIKAQGKGEDYLKEATIKTQEINSAYEMIKKARS